MSTKSHIKKTFSVNMQPLFTEKRKFANKITLQDSEENIISDDTLVSEELNNFLMILLFPENIILFFRRKVKDDLSQKNYMEI